MFSDLELTQEEKDATLQFVLRSMRPQAIKVRADVQITCFNSKGIEGVRAALVSALGSCVGTRSISLSASMFTVCFATHSWLQRPSAQKKSPLRYGGFAAAPVPCKFHLDVAGDSLLAISLICHADSLDCAAFVRYDCHLHGEREWDCRFGESH